MSSNFTITPNLLLMDDNLSLDEKYMLIALKSFDYKRRNVVYPSYESLMICLSTKRREKISKVLKSLEGKKYIYIEKNIGKLNKYHFLKDYLISEK